MIAFTIRSYAMTLYFLMVIALPERSDTLPKNMPLVHQNNVIRLAEPTLQILSLDALCAHIYQPWWIRMKGLRSAYAKDMRNNPEHYRSTFVPLEYKEYADRDPPVQAIWASKGEISLVAGWRYETYFCSGSCQDIRPTMEWIVTGLLTLLPQKRVRKGVVLPCPRGYKSALMKNPSRREYDTLEKETTAIGVLQQQRGEYPFTTEPLYSEEIVGDTDPIVTSCECVHMTAEEQETTLRHLEQLRKRMHINSESKRRRSAGEPRRRRYKQSKAAEPVETSVPVPIPTSDALPAEVDDYDVPIAFDDQTPQYDITCYDFDYPDLPEFGISQSHQSESQFEIPSDLPELDPDVVAFLQASLSDFSDFESVASSSGTKNTGKGF